MTIETGTAFPIRQRNNISIRIRILCIAVSLLLIISAVAETWYMLETWFNGEAFQDIYDNYARFYPQIVQYAVGSKFVYILTMVVDLLGFIPFYVALTLIGLLFYKLRDGDFIDDSIITLLKATSLLLIVDASFPAIRDTLQMLIFTAGKHPILVLSMGISSGGVRLFILAMGLYAAALILQQSKARLTP